MKATGIEARIVTTFKGKPSLTLPNPTQEANKYTLVGIAKNLIKAIAEASRRY